MFAYLDPFANICMEFVCMDGLITDFIIIGVSDIPCKKMATF